jgi:dipeptide/tripeptide permease
MQDYVTAGGALVFLVGILAVGLSGNQGVRFRSLFFLVGLTFILVGTGAELSALIASRGNSNDSASSTASPS